MGLKRAMLIMITAAGLFLSGCFTVNGSWPSLSQNLDALDPRGTLAVVAGQRTRHGARLAELLTERLTGKPGAAALTILAQDEIARRLAVYPSNLGGDALLAEENLDGPDFSAAHLAACAALGKKLNVDYLLVVWFPAVEFFRTETASPPGRAGIVGDHFVLTVCGRLIKRPENKVVGYVRFDYNRMDAPTFKPRYMSDFLDMTLKESADLIVAPLRKSWRVEQAKE
jgi:hypothetical protein